MAVSVSSYANCIGALTAISEEALIEQPWLFPKAIKERLSDSPHLSLIDVPAPEMLPQIQLMIETLKKQKDSPNSDYRFFKRQALAALVEASKNPKLGSATLAIMNALASLTPKPPAGYNNPESPASIKILKHEDKDKFILIVKKSPSSGEGRFVVSSEYPIYFTAKWLSKWQVSKAMDFYAVTGIGTNLVNGQYEIGWVKADGNWVTPLEYALHDLAHALRRLEVGSSLSVEKRTEFWQLLEARLLEVDQNVRAELKSTTYDILHEQQLDLASPFAIAQAELKIAMSGKEHPHVARAATILISTIRQITGVSAPAPR